MTDVNKPKLQLRSGLSINGDKTPSPAASKLLINHGKPNFTIPRSYKTHNGSASPTSPPPPSTAGSNFQHKNINNNNNEFVVKSTTFNGVFKPSNISVATRQTLPQNGNAIDKNFNNNEAAKVVLRRPRVVQTEVRERDDDDDNVPEFIRRQRRIQERLANQNILDFENRRSGYFTQVMISPSSPNRQSFVETMASPAVKPGLEMPAPATPQEDNKIETISEEQKIETPQQEEHQHSEDENGSETVSSEPITLNGHVEEEEVAKAIEEVNKAVEGEGEEDEDKIELEDLNKISQQEAKEIEYHSAALNELKSEEIQPKKDENQSEELAALGNLTAEEISIVEPNVSSITEVITQQISEEKDQEDLVSTVEKKIEQESTNGHVEAVHHESDCLKTESLDSAITICHANGINGPSIPTPDPSGEKGVNFETKTVVSFSQELGNGDNKYPDTVKVVQNAEPADGELKELTKLKFEITADHQEIEVKPVLVNETA